VDTGAVYRAWDEGHRPERAPRDGSGDNDLEPAALAVVPALARWRDALARATGRRPRLAGSGAAWFVDGDEDVAEVVGPSLEVDGRRGVVLALRTIDAWASPDAPLPPRGAGVLDR
jgi:4-diphosphocytidyl-2C-methyl-D-erythritol kinase